MKTPEIQKLLAGFLWYSIPVFYLTININRSLPIATLATFLLLVGWILGGILSTNFVLIDYVKIKPKKLFKFGIVLLAMAFVLQLIALNNLFSQFNLINYRASVFEDSEFLFGSSILFTFYNSFVFPLLLFGVPVVALLPKTRSTTLLFYALLFFLLIEAIIKFGRFPILFVTFFIIYFRNIIKIKWFKILSIIFLILPAMQIILFYRQYSEIEDLSYILNSWEIFIESVVYYNIIGFIIFDEIASSSPIEVNPFNFNSFSGFLYYFEIFLGRFGMQIWYPWKTLILDLSDARYISELNIIANAFGTNLMPVYFDLGFLGPLLLGFLLGFFSIIKTSGVISGAVACMAFFVMIFGIYKSIIVAPVSVILILPVILTLARLRRKIVR